MSYGLTNAGFRVKPANVIEQELSAAIRGVDGLENAVIDADSAIGQFVAIMTEREALLWGLMLSVYQSAFRETATGVSLDRTQATVGKSRIEQRRSTVPLTLYNRTSTSPVTVLADSQARQNATGVVWETLTDAEIPALAELLNTGDVDSLAHQAGNVIRAVFNGNPVLSGVHPGDLVTISSSTNSSNNGEFPIIAVNAGAYWIEYENPARSDNTDDESSDSPAIASIQDVETSVVVQAQSLSAGPFEASIGSINAIVTPVSGWDAVSNLETAQVGQSDEQDDAFRVRAQSELVIAQGSTVEAVKRAIRNVPGVTYVAGEVNRTPETDGNGNRPNSYRFTVVGGTDQAVIDAIGSTVAGGLDTNGSVTGYYSDPGDEPQLFRFDRVTEINPYFVVELDVDDDLYPDNGTELVQTALNNLQFEHGQDVLNHLAVAAVSNANIPGVLTITVLQGLSPDPVTSANIVIAPAEVANVIIDRITVDATPV